jgi:hypothetical protein
LLRDYHRVGASSSDQAVATLGEMKTAFPDAPETSEVIAMTFAGGTLVPVPVAVPVMPVQFASVTPAAPALPSGAWLRFDSMRSGTGTAPAPTTSTSVTTTVTTTTSSGGP